MVHFLTVFKYVLRYLTHLTLFCFIATLNITSDNGCLHRNLYFVVMCFPI